ncbi:MAG TPA: DNA recombination protein RmuC [Mariprofundaceae bacterium]|nr:DNA recombination protein RmuC [Mariprofundaceae bacterium]
MNIEIMLAAFGLAFLILFTWLLLKLRNLERSMADHRTTLLPGMGEMLEQKQRQLVHELHAAIRDSSAHISNEVRASMKASTDTLNQQFERLTDRVDNKLETISGRVNERLDKGFEKTQKVFADVLARLSTIDEAQKRIDQLSRNVVSLQDVLTDKRARGAFGEVQLHQLVSQVLPESAYTLQAPLSNSRRVDCLLKLPEPVGAIAIDAKFPLENYQLSLDGQLGEQDRRQAASQFRQDVRKHINDIAERYIVPDETADSAIMFLPSEAVFAELHAHYPDIIALAQQRRVWIASPTTMMAILTTVVAALKDIETRKQVHIIQIELARLAEDFSRFGSRFDKLAQHIRQAHEDTQQIHTSAKKISSRFERIERVELREEDSEN